MHLWKMHHQHHHQWTPCLHLPQTPLLVVLWCSQWHHQEHICLHFWGSCLVLCLLYLHFVVGLARSCCGCRDCLGRSLHHHRLGTRLHHCFAPSNDVRARWCVYFLFSSSIIPPLLMLLVFQLLVFLVGSHRHFLAWRADHNSQQPTFQLKKSDCLQTVLPAQKESNAWKKKVGWIIGTLRLEAISRQIFS